MKLLPQHLVDERDRNRAFADGRRDALDVAAPHVSDGEDAGPAGFEQVRMSCQRPARFAELLGGHERNLDCSEFGAGIPENIRTVILFPATGERIWKAIQEHSRNAILPSPFFVTSMQEAVKIAYAKTERGKICLLSPASPSFGMFKDYRERGDSFKALVKDLSKTDGSR